MRKEFKVGEYYIFYGAKKKVGKAKIHALIQIDGILHAVFTYYIDGVIKHIRTLPVEIEENADAIHFGGAGCYLTADAPVQPKVVKFKVGEVYFNKSNEFTVTAKYTSPKGRTYLIFEDIYILEVRTNEYNVEYVEFSNANADGEGARFDACDVLEIEE